MELGGRLFTRSTGGIWTIESPRMLFDVLELFERNGVTDAISGHLGECPVMSVGEVQHPTDLWPHIPGGWHQDGFNGHRRRRVHRRRSGCRCRTAAGTRLGSTW